MQLARSKISNVLSQFFFDKGSQNTGLVLVLAIIVLYCFEFNMLANTKFSQIVVWILTAGFMFIEACLFRASFKLVFDWSGLFTVKVPYHPTPHFYVLLRILITTLQLKLRN